MLPVRGSCMRRSWLSARGHRRRALSAWTLSTLFASAASAAPPAASFGDEEGATVPSTAPTAQAAPVSPAPAESPPPPRAFAEPSAPPAAEHPPSTATTGAPPGDEPDAPVAKAVAPAQAASPETRRRIGSSAHADRVVLLPTAYTHPKGTFYVSDYDIVILQAGYAFTDSTQLTATFTPPIEEELIVPLDLSLKVSSDSATRVRVAGIGSVTGILGFDDGPVLVGRAGGTAQFCFDDACRSSVTTAATAVLVGTVVLMGGTGAEVRALDWLSLLLEADIALPLGLEPAQAKGLLFAGGVRFPFRNWALDLTVAGSASAFDGTGAAPVPLLAYTYRWMPSAYRHAPR